MRLDRTALLGLFRSIHEAVVAGADELTALDQAIGDGDLGLTMKTGFKTICEFLEAQGDDVPAAELITQAGFAMAEKAPSTMGTLVSIGIARAGNSFKEKEELDAAAALAMLEAACAGIASRGKAKRGEKTVLDALFPAIDAFRDAVSKGAGLPGAARAAAEAARSGAKATAALQSVYGRASVFGESSIGKQDPGATAGAMILEGASAWFSGRA